MTKKVMKLPAFIECQDVFYSTEEVIKKVKKSFAEAKSPLTDEKIAEQTGLPVKVVKDGIKMLQKSKQLRILDPEKNQMRHLRLLASI